MDKKIYKVSGLKAKAAFQVDFSTAPNDIEYMPQGTHTISCTVGGKAKEITITCTEESAAVFQSSLDAVNAQFDAGEMSRPFIDFDHKGGEAAAFPKRFFWKDGVRLEVEWTEAGRRAVENKQYNYVSPEFLFGEDGVPVGVASPGAIGALVNVPAFQTIQRISAKLTQTKETIMTETKPDEGAKQTPDAAELEKKLAEKDNEIAALKAQLEEKGNGSESGDKKIEELTARIDELEKGKKEAEDKAECARKSAIENTVDALVKAGRVKADGKDALVKAALASDDNGNAIFAAIPEVPLGAEPVTAQAGRQAETVPGTGISRAAAAFNKELKGN